MTDIEIVEPEMIFGAVRDLHDEGYRLVQIHCTQKKVGVHDGDDITYTFDRDLKLRQLRVLLPEGFVLDSISPVYEYAFLYENEIKDLFGVQFHNLTIDFGGKLYTTAQKHPMKNEAPKE